MIEEWKEINGFEGKCWISNLGRVRGVRGVRDVTKSNHFNSKKVIRCPISGDSYEDGRCN